MKIKRYAAFGTAAMMMLACFTGCKGESTVGEDNAILDSLTGGATLADVQIRNFEMPVEGEKIAVINIENYGEIKIKLFSDAAAKGVENFTGLAEMGYYDELIFHRIIPGFMMQGGDPKGNGTGGKSIWGEKFEGGVPEGLYHFSGAVAYANSGSTSTNGSQFYIVNTDEGYASPSCQELMEYDISTYNWPQNVIDMYAEKGGTPSLDGGYTVFGQVFEGMDIVREIANVETDENDKPLTQIKMESVKIVEYTAE